MGYKCNLLGTEKGWRVLNKRKQFITLARSAGFGIIELMITVAILGIVLLVAIPSFKEWIENTKVRNIASSIHNGLQLARAEAVTRNTQVVFTLAGNSWTVGCVTATATCPAMIQQYTADSGTTNISATTIPASKTAITYSNLGNRVTTGAAGLASFNTVDVVSNIAGTRSLRIEVGASGSARLCDPEFAIADTPRGCN